MRGVPSLRATARWYATRNRLHDTVMANATVVGAGLAGCECAWQLAERNVRVTLVEQRPLRMTPAHETEQFAELVCSNSFRSLSPTIAVGSLKQELLASGSLLITLAQSCRVPAGGALAVDRNRFSQAVTNAICTHPNITVVRQTCDKIPRERPCVIATGPLTSNELAADIARTIGVDNLAYYDAIAPIVDADSVDFTVAFRQSRYGANENNPHAQCDAPDNEQATRDDQAYVNCPFDEAQYHAFVDALIREDKVQAHHFEDARYFEGCLPIEELASRGVMTLAFGPMKPVGLIDTRTGKRPFAVVQLRPENVQNTAFNLVGFQTRLTQPAQGRVFRMIPGLHQASFLRWGSIHRNTFVHAPSVLDDTLQLRAAPGVYLAGQVTGVEGYVESIACGLMCGWMLAETIKNRNLPRPGTTTTLGALMAHLTNTKAPFQPSNITWAHVPPIPQRMKKELKKQALAQRAMSDLHDWLARVQPVAPVRNSPCADPNT